MLPPPNPVNEVDNISSRRESERLLEFSESQFRDTFSRAPLGMVIAALDGRFIESNEAYCNITGYAREELASISFISLTHPDELANNRELFRRLLAGEVDSYVIEKRVRVKSGSFRWVRAHGSLLRDTDGKRVKVIGLVEDIDARKKAEQDLEEASEALRRANGYLHANAAELQRSNEDLSQFAYTASHDLRSPLKTIALYAELLDRRFGPQIGAEGNELLSFVTGAAQRMSVLIEDLLFYAQMSSGSSVPIEPADANASFRVANENLRSAIIESDAEVTNDDLPMVAIDATQLVQIFQNLIGNAIRYRSARRPNVHVSAAARGHEWLFSCRDNGIGVASQYHAKIFEPFKRLHGVEVPGSGLGLSVCRKIVERHQGRLWVESAPDEGSTFFFTLPRA